MVSDVRSEKIRNIFFFIRVFDGLGCDQLEIYLAESQLGKAPERGSFFLSRGAA